MTAASPRPPALIEAPLDWPLCQALGSKLAAADSHECISMGVTPVQALASGVMLGWSRAVLRSHTKNPVGAFGFTPQGTIWSLWAPLGRRESAQVLKETRGWVSRMLRTNEARAYAKPLHNFVHCDNMRARNWLAATRCFNVDIRSTKIAEDHWFYFETKPLEEIA